MLKWLPDYNKKVYTAIKMSYAKLLWSRYCSKLYIKAELMCVLNLRQWCKVCFNKLNFLLTILRRCSTDNGAVSLAIIYSVAARKFDNTEL